MINIMYLHAGAEMYGADKVLLDLIKNLDKNIFNPIVVLPEKGVLCDALSEYAEVMVVDYPILRRKYFNPKGIVYYFNAFLKYSKQLVKIAKEKNIDLVHVNTSAVFEGIYLKKKAGLPIVWHIHEIIVKPKFMYKLTSRIIAKYSDEVSVVSNAVKEHLINSGYFKKEINVIYNGVDSNRFCLDEEGRKSANLVLNLPDNSMTIGMIGRVNSWKGQASFLKAANIVMSKLPNVYTIFAGNAYKGEEWREEELKAQIDASEHKNRIINLGYRSDSENIYNMLDVFVLPSIQPDPLPTVVLEAMACQKPVVGYRHGGVCEMVKEGHNGLLAKPCDEEQLALRIIELLEDDDLRNVMAENSRERVLKLFSLKSYADNFSILYKKTFK
ncbi:MAG: glycosyltransferase family 4 protein [Clostridiales bacterium]|nr:glycosyltransferase family 4 protein [Clostridiales bacterium]